MTANASSRPFRAVLFDMDGVLVDSEPQFYLALNRVIAAHGAHLTEEENLAILGTTVEYTWEWVHRRFGLPGHWRDYLGRYDEEVCRALTEPTEPLPGVRETLSRLSALGIPRALVSTSHLPWIQTVLQAGGLDGHFPVIVSAEMVERGKPAPDGYLLAAQRLAIPTEECLVFEDSRSGVQAARAAGCFVIALRAATTARAMPPVNEAHMMLDSLLDFDWALLDPAAPDITCHSGITCHSDITCHSERSEESPLEVPQLDRRDA